MKTTLYISLTASAALPAFEKFSFSNTNDREDQYLKACGDHGIFWDFGGTFSKFD
ncbi:MULTISPECIES: hypothetical protein [Burkholderia]|uniref:hypothetical protein n=1 Tax=Burkholderia TaxID=32008 RepID=UPI0013648F92|nr:MULTISPECIES: hypothetical protein [Burkholderia]ELK6466137.1 hypothetical protein [Burkholderia contaminans]HEM7879831.1 hypothetical protein [Burkholderia contaminans]